jgi:hypothetical protein
MDLKGSMTRLTVAVLCLAVACWSSPPAYAQAAPDRTMDVAGFGSVLIFRPRCGELNCAVPLSRGRVVR